MADPAPAQPQPQPVEHLTGWAAIASAASRAFNNLTNEKLLLVVVLALLGFRTFDDAKRTSEDKMFIYRSTEERIERERQHCDSREERLKLWCDQQIDKERKYSSDREDKLKGTFETSITKIEAAVAKVLAKLSEKTTVLPDAILRP